MMKNRHNARQYEHVLGGHIGHNKKEETGGWRRVENNSHRQEESFSSSWSLWNIPMYVGAVLSIRCCPSSQSKVAIVVVVVVVVEYPLVIKIHDNRSNTRKNEREVKRSSSIHGLGPYEFPCHDTTILVHESATQ